MHHRILDTADYGVLHRERLIIVGIRTDQLKKLSISFTTYSWSRFINKLLPFNCGNALLNFSKKLSNEGLSGRFGHLLQKIPPGLNYSFLQKRWDTQTQYLLGVPITDFLYKADPERPVRTPRLKAVNIQDCFIGKTDHLQQMNLIIANFS